MKAAMINALHGDCWQGSATGRVQTVEMTVFGMD